MKRVTFETAKLAKEATYTKPGWGYYSEEDVLELFRGTPPFPAPYQAELQEWLRNEYKLNIIVDFYDNCKYYGYEVIVYDSKNREFHDEDLIDQATPHYVEGVFDSYEEALEKGLVEGLKILIENEVQDTV